MREFYFRTVCQRVLLLLLQWPVAVAWAQQDCHSITDDSERLRCYDQNRNKSYDQIQTETITETEQSQSGQIIVDESTADTALSSNTIPAENTVLETRQQEEQALLSNRFGILPYRRTYVLPITYVRNINEQPYQDLLLMDSDESLQNTEIKFQFSFKVPIGHEFLFSGDEIYFTYTQRSLWQAYNSDISSPFRETNYEPELLWSIPLSEPLFNGRLSHVVLGINHQSNGRSGSLSRSWNRLTLDTTWADEDWAIALRLWYRLKEAADNDDNPDIEDYVGHGELRVGYQWDELRFTGVFRNNLERHDNHTSADISFSKPLNKKLRGFIQYVNAYGETLIDYNHRTQRIGFGIVLSDWF